MAATMLSSQRTGAIIAIEREIGLRNYIESGIPIDATLTYDLLVTIFQTGSPLHDGAVIVQEDRIAAAACFLPLTVNPRVSRDLGTRHRAAIGLTEENDAVAIVVSEERGQIALAMNGRIERAISPDELRERLGTFVMQRRGSGRAGVSSNSSCSRLSKMSASRRNAPRAPMPPYCWKCPCQGTPRLATSSSVAE